MTHPPRDDASVIERLEGLIKEAGKWPDELIPEGDGKNFECPACGGEGSIQGELVHSLHAGLVGVQVYGIGDQMAAMEKLLPEMIHRLPQLIALARIAETIGDDYHAPGCRIYFGKDCDCGIRDLRQALSPLFSSPAKAKE